MKAQIQITSVQPDRIYLVDRDGPMSVTNDAEAVVKFINDMYPGRRIIYCDTMGNWDELLHDNGRFTDFAPYRENSERGN